MLVLPGIVRAEEPAAFAIGDVATATVKAIDPAARTVTLEAADGNTRTVTCGKAVVNFDQIKVGDQVNAMAVGRVAVAVGKPGSADTSNAEGGASIARAPRATNRVSSSPTPRKLPPRSTASMPPSTWSPSRAQVVRSGRLKSLPTSIWPA